MLAVCFKLFIVNLGVLRLAQGKAPTNRSSAERLRQPNSSTMQSTSLSSTVLPSYERFFKTLSEGPLSFLNMVSEEKATNDLRLAEQQDEYDALMEVFESLAANMAISMSMQTSLPTTIPTTGPTPGATATLAPSPDKAPETPDTLSPTAAPKAVTAAPTNAISPPTGSIVTTPFPSDPPTAAPLKAVTSAPTMKSASPTLSNCPGISAQERLAQIVSILEAATNDFDLLDEQRDQGKATSWILNEDDYQICPDNDKLVQRWALAVMYFATGGEGWLQCSASASAVDNCGNESPFVDQTRFLSSAPECEWAGITCIDGCVTEIEFEENNLVGTIPTEMGLFSELLVWGMERGRLSSTIPTEIAQLQKLIFLDLDYNELTGTLTGELFSLQSLTQLDLNNNKLSGNINGIGGGFPKIEFLQLHDNLFTGTVPASIGSYTNLSAFTLHESLISGDMPKEVCDLLLSEDKGGVLTSLIADCTTPNQNINCSCCTDCRVPQ